MKVSKQEADANRERIVEVASRLFREKGFDGTTIRDISAAARMHSGSPFYHFKTKQAMLVAVMEEGLRHRGLAGSFRVDNDLVRVDHDKIGHLGVAGIDTSHFHREIEDSSQSDVQFE